MLFAAHLGGLEVRETKGGATRLWGRFPYGREASLGRGRMEVFASRAFAGRIEAGEEIFLLAGHSFDRPLASKQAGTLELRDHDDALEVEAMIPAELRGVTWVADLLAAHAAGLVRGLSPGFRVPPGGERVERRSDGLLRTVTRAELHEISVVTRPAYAEAMVEARNWQPEKALETIPPFRALARWRL